MSLETLWEQNIKTMQLLSITQACILRNNAYHRMTDFPVEEIVYPSIEKSPQITPSCQTNYQYQKYFFLYVKNYMLLLKVVGRSCFVKLCIYQGRNQRQDEHAIELCTHSLTLTSIDMHAQNTNTVTIFQFHNHQFKR